MASKKVASADIERLPEKLSPSRAKDFMQCPRLFYYKTVLGLATPPSPATAKGTVAHHAFERLFDHPREERVVATAVSYVRPAWAMMTDPVLERSAVAEGSPEYSLREKNKSFRDLVEQGSKVEKRLMEDAAAYRALFAAGGQEETAFLEDVERAVEGWFAMETPSRFDPAELELYVAAKVAGVTLHGFIDRLDRVSGSDGTERWYITDYKTGRKPGERFADEAFFQLEVYALCVQQRFGVTPYQLRLLYVREGSKTGVLTKQVNEQVLEKAKAKVKATWAGIQKAARSGVWEARKQVLCDWCPFKSVCPAWFEGADTLLPEEIARRTGTAPHS